MAYYKVKATRQHIYGTNTGEKESEILGRRSDMERLRKVKGENFLFTALP